MKFRTIYFCALVFLNSSLGLLAAKPLNVLFIMTDDLNCDLPIYGDQMVKTPNIDGLAEQGMTFNNAFCNFPLCGPSRASFMTGLYPEQNGVVRICRLFRYYVPGAITMPQHFRNNGYTVARVGKMFHYDNPGGIGTNGHDDPDSWDIRINPSGCDVAEEDQIYSLKPGGDLGSTLSWLASDCPDEAHTDGMVATESIRLMRQFKTSEKPFFLAVGFYKPHTPFVAPKKYFDMYDPESIEVPRIPENYLNTLPPAAVRILTRKPEQNHLPVETAQEVIRAYYATISFLDAQVGRVLDELKRLGLEDNTIVLFSSDHGYHLGEHDYYQKSTLFENDTRVPLIISYPGMDHSGERSDSLVEMIDFYKTLSELAGTSAPADYVQGKSLVSILDNPEDEVRDVAFAQIPQGYSIRTKRYRYNRWVEGHGLMRELYDRLNDSAEMVNLALDANYQDVLIELDHLLERKIEETSEHPSSLKYYPPKDRFFLGVTQEEYLKLEREGNLPRYVKGDLE